MSTLPRAVLEKYHNPVFLETGTMQGGGIDVAMACGFPHIISIEVHRQSYENAVKKYSRYPHVELHCGDSLKLLPTIISKLETTITFWLDAHGIGWSPQGGLGEKNCPILEELEIIAEHPIKNHVILIDDRRMFGTTGTVFEDITGVMLERCWGISEEQIEERLLRINPAYTICYEDGVEPYANLAREGDIIAAATASYLLCGKK